MIHDGIKIHEMKLNEKPFEDVLQGKKTVELRLNDEKRQLIEVGDFISFSMRTEEGVDPFKLIVAEVVALHRYASFAELLATDLKDKSGFSALSVEEATQKMREYYTEEEEQKYGVLGIELEVI